MLLSDRPKLKTKTAVDVVELFGESQPLTETGETAPVVLLQEVQSHRQREVIKLVPNNILGFFFQIDC